MDLKISQKQKPHNLFRILFFVFLFLFLLPIMSQAQLKHLQNVTDMPPHPRILMFAGEEEQIKANIAADPAWDKIHQYIMKESDGILLQPEVERVMIGRRLLNVSQDAIRRIFYLSYAYRMSGQEKYFLKAEKEMLSIATFSDWNPSHFLDVAEMTMAMAIGYDWLYGKLSPDSREIIKSAILQKGIDPSLKINFANWTNNWGQVCNAGMTYGALATFEDAPDLCKMVIDRAVETIRIPMRQYAPDGAYAEGFEYWAYGTTHNVMFLSAIEKVLKTDYGLPEMPGFMKTADYILNMTGPSNVCFNYADCEVWYMTGLTPAMFWFASKSGNTSLLWVEREHMRMDNGRRLTSKHLTGYEHDYRYSCEFFASKRFVPASMIWGSHIRMSEIQPPASGETIWVGHGTTPVALMRTSWTDPDALFAGFVTGHGSGPHGHLDVGSFVMEADGVRWASDLGLQEYSTIESKGVNLWDGSQNGQRWKVFRYNNFAHNTLTVDHQPHRVDGYADIRSYSASPDFMNAISDISAVFDGQLTECVRGIAMVDKQYVVVRDELKTLDKATTVRWTMVASEDAKITGKNTIELKKDGKQLKLEVAEPAEATMKTWSTDPTTEYDKPNPGTILVGFEVNVPAETSVALTVKLIPQSAKNTSAKVPELKDWPK